MDAIKVEDDDERHGAAAAALASLVLALSASPAAAHQTACGKLLGNLSGFLAAPATADSPRRQLGARRVVAALCTQDLTAGVMDWLRSTLQPLSRRPSDCVQSAAAEPLSPEARAVALLNALLPTSEERQAAPQRRLPSAVADHVRELAPVPSLLALARALEAALSEVAAGALAALMRVAELGLVPLWPDIRGTLLTSIVHAPAGATATAAAAGAQRLGDVAVLVQLLQALPKSAVLPHAATLLPVALRCATDEDRSVRHAVAGLFGRLARDVALAPLDAANSAAADSAAADSAAADASRAPAAPAAAPPPPPAAAAAAASAAAAVDELSANGALIIRHLVRGEPLRLLSRAALPPALRGALAPALTLRPYQWEGVTWCDFLRRTGTNGCLADEMGLGKTLQALVAVALCRALRGADAAPALVVCPPTLVHHWQSEARRFFGDAFAGAIAYVGAPARRRRLAAALPSAPLVVTSYPVVLRDSGSGSDGGGALGAVRWSYLVLDEAHLLRNPAGATAAAVRGLRAAHRLALTGTPIQNTVAEVWCMFDVLMPGYLGERADFKASYVTPTRAVLEAGGRSAAGAGSDVGGVLAGMRVLDRLHRQVLPFVLRREKRAVLAHLPPKTVTDLACDMPPRQRRVYEGVRRCARDAAPGGGGEGGKREVFKWLKLQQLACVHPALVAPDDRAGAAAGAAPPATATMRLADSCKLLALRQLLWDCGIGLTDCTGADDGDSESGADGGRRSQRRQPRGGGGGASDEQQQQQQSGGDGMSDDTDAESASAAADDGAAAACKCLVFAQHRAALDAIEACLLRPHLPSVRYLRMDGATPQAARAPVLEAFAADAGVSLLLLTTAVGGLGLNLTVANTVVFMEHSWNPQVDAQAMDRAHRIGQRRAVNVYRLVARGTIEERILTLQAGKRAAAERVVGADNAALWAMDTDSVLQLFGEAIAGGDGDGSGGGGGGGGEESEGEEEEARRAEEEYGGFSAESFARSLRRRGDEDDDG